MRIAIIGWGSLLWNPGNLHTIGKWHPDGPMLPVEFARISRDKRVTLVIMQGAKPQRTYWIRSALENINDAICDLACREGTPFSRIHGVDAFGKVYGTPPDFALDAVSQWLNRHVRDANAAIWTGLASNWEERLGEEFSADAVVEYLKRLDDETKQRAREYFEKAPPQIQTEVRRLVEEALGWRAQDSV